MSKYKRLFGAFALIAGLAMFAGNAAALGTITPPDGATLTQARVGTGYAQPISVTYDGGSGDIAWTSEDMPAGLSIDEAATGLLNAITGTPGAAGTFTPTITATPADGDPISATYTITVIAALGAISPGVLADGQVGEPYNVTFTVAGATGPLNWSVTGNVPPGLTIAPLTGVLSGTPTVQGSYSFTVEVTDTATPAVTTSGTRSITIDAPDFVAMASHGQIAYVENIVRDVNGIILTTGDLYVLNLQTKEKHQVTDYAGAGNILNPQLTADGSEVLYTSDISGTYRVYLVSTQSTVSAANEGVKLQAAVDLQYAALSPNYDSDAEVGLIAYTYQRADRTELWVYNLATKLNTQIRSVRDLVIRDLVLTDSTTIAYIGIPASGVQDIYIISASGGAPVNLTGNSAPTPLYGRLQSSVRNPGIDPMLIYSKRVWGGYGYRRWDVFIRPDLLPGTADINVTGTSDIDEYSPTFYGDDVLRGVFLLPAMGQMFYEAAILTADRDIWQANYNTAVDSNVSRMQRVTEANVNFGMANWSPLPPDTGLPAPVAIDQTRIVFASPADDQIYRADLVGAAWTSQVITSTDTPKFNPSMSRLGGTVVLTDFINDAEPDFVPYVYKIMNHDGSGYETYNNTAVLVRSFNGQATLSNDSRWVAYSYKTGPNTWDIRGKAITDLVGAGTVLVTGMTREPTGIALNPEMTKLAFAYDDSHPLGPGNGSIYIKDIKVDNIAGTIVPTPNNTLPVAITQGHTDDFAPSFSNCGTKIIHVSNRWGGVYAIYTMGVGGSTIEQVREGAGLANPIYGPVTTTADGVTTDVVAWMEGAAIYTGTLYRDIANNPGASAGRNPVVGAANTGLSSSGRFSWGIRREKGSILSQRYLPSRTASGAAFVYDVVVDIDEAAKPNAYTLNEVMPMAFTVNGVTWSGGVGALPFANMADTPVVGLRTIKIDASVVSTARAVDNAFRFNVTTPAATGNRTVSGNLNYWLEGLPVTTDTLGNARVRLGRPFIPVDIYDKDNESEPDGIIQDFDLLYAVESWVHDAQLTGYGPRWPEETDNWDLIILDVIAIWANVVHKGGYEYDPTIAGAAHEMNWQAETPPDGYWD